MKTDEAFVQRHLDTVKVLKALNGAEQFYVTCFPGDKDAVQITGTNTWIRKIDIQNIKFAFEAKNILDKNRL